MPLYEYECTACHKHTEKIQKFSDPEITTCPHCSGTLKRVITAPAISFKGGGWYADGYGNAKPAGDSKTTPAVSSKTDSASSSSDSSSATPVAAPAAAPAAAQAATTSTSDKK
ncbi:FmdB family zinc ribbon protein [Granulicella arctica]|uniref:FmdB family zinc ribbon protein n=1 Tax=Granulicella arctica TaxID=940613 RepID=UPI0021E01AEE|nr:zinc ribbon domain-containing protein [Granulicella arctica]